jgi:hypothetical protein
MEKLKFLLELTKSQFHTPLNLILGVIILLGGFAFIDDFLEKFLNIEIRGFFYVIVVVVLIRIILN